MATNSVGLIKQLCERSGLSGVALEALRTRLEKLSEDQLRAEFANSKHDLDKGVTLENATEEIEQASGFEEKVISTNDENGNVIETIVTLHSGKPLKTIKKVNGNKVETTTYTYHDATDSNAAYVTLTTEKSNQSTVTTNVLEVDENGEYAAEDFVDRTTVSMSGKKQYVYVLDNLIYEEVSTSNANKDVLTVYNGNNLDELDNGELKRLYQRAGQNEVVYDGQGNTITHAANNDSIERLKKKFNMTTSELLSLNKGIDKKLKVGQRIVVKGERNADSPEILKQGTIEQALSNYNKYVAIPQQIREQYPNISDKNYAELGQSFKPSKENHIFYSRFNLLTAAEQQNVLSMIKYCKSQNITDIEKVKAEILKIYPEINLFDSGKSIPMYSANNRTPHWQRQESGNVSIETFVKDILKLDINSGEGKTIYERMIQLSPEQLGQISAAGFKKFTGEKTFQNIADAFASCGVNLRTSSEIQEIANSPREVQRRKAREKREVIAQYLTIAIDNAINHLQSYQDNQGWINVGFYREKLGKLLDKVNPTDVACCMETVIKQLEEGKKFALTRLSLAADNPRQFEATFKELTGIEYNEANMDTFLNLAKNGGEEWTDAHNKAYNKAFGTKLLDWAMKKTDILSWTDGAMDIVLMLMGTEAIGKGIGIGLEKTVGKKALAAINSTKAGRVAFAAGVGGTTLATWTATSGTVNNLTKAAETTSEDWEMLAEATVESFGFGAFGGILNETVVAKVVKAFDKPAPRMAKAVADSFKTSETMTGSQVLQTAIKAENSVSLLAKGAGFLTEVVGFTAYETALDVVKDICDPKTGRLPEDMTFESLVEYLGETAWGQVKMLGEIKGISALLMMRKGGKVGQQIIQDQMLKSEALDNLKFKPVNINGRELLEVTYPNGNRRVATSAEEAISIAQITMQLDFLTKTMADKSNSKAETQVPQGHTTEEDILLEHAAEENPAEVVADKVKTEWLRADLETGVPETEQPLIVAGNDGKVKLNLPEVEEPLPVVNDEVTGLIFKGKLKETFEKRYDEMGKVFSEIMADNSAEIKQLASECKNDKQAFAAGVVKILAREFGLEGFEPEIKLVDQMTGGAADWYNGTILIDSNITNAKKLTELISHEFVHMLQLRDVIAQYGEQGVREMIMNDNSIPAADKEAKIQSALTNPYNKHLLESYNSQRAETGSLNDYVRRVYKEEFTNTADSDNTEAYTNQAIEREAYNLGSNKLGSNVHGVDDIELEKKDWEVKPAEVHNSFVVNSDGSITFTGIPQGKLTPKFPTPNEYEEKLAKVEERVEELYNNLKANPKNIDMDALRAEVSALLPEFTEYLHLVSEFTSISKGCFEELSNRLQGAKELPPEQVELLEKFNNTVTKNTERASQMAQKFNEIVKIVGDYKEANFDTTTIEPQVAKALVSKVVESEYEQKEILTACTINGNINKALLDKAINLITTQEMDAYSVSGLLESCKSKDGAIPAQLNRLDKLLELGFDKYKCDSILEMCKNAPESADIILSKVEEINDTKNASYIIKCCVNKDGQFEPALYEKVKELMADGIKNENITNIMELCYFSGNSPEISAELYSKVFELKNKYNIEQSEISNILERCNIDNKFSQPHYEGALWLKEHNISDREISRIIYKYNGDINYLNSVVKLKEKYNLKASEANYILKSCMLETDGVKKFNSDMLAKAEELLTNFNADRFEVQNILETSVVNNEFNIEVYNNILELINSGTNISTSTNIINNCIKSKGFNSEQTINTEAIEAVKRWKKAGESDDFLKNVTSVLKQCDSSESANIDAIEKLIKAQIDREQLGNMLPKLCNNNTNNIDLDLTDRVLELNKLGVSDADINDILQKCYLGTWDVSTEALNQVIQLVKSGIKSDFTILYYIGNKEGKFDQETIDLILQAKAETNADSKAILAAIQSARENRSFNMERFRENLENAVNMKNLTDFYAFNNHMQDVPELKTLISTFIKNGGEFKSLNYIMNACKENYNELNKVAYEKVLSFINENMDKQEQIINILRDCKVNNGRIDMSALEFCLRNPDNYQNLLNACRQGWIIDPKRTEFLNSIDISKVDEKILSDFLNSSALRREPALSPEVQDKLKYMLENGMFNAENALNFSNISVLNHNEAPEILDEIIKLYNENAITSEDLAIIPGIISNLKSYNTQDKPFTNYKEALKAYSDNKLAADLINLCSEYIDEEFNIEKYNKLVALKETGFEKSGLGIIYCETLLSDKYLDKFIEFASKLDYDQLAAKEHKFTPKLLRDALEADLSTNDFITFLDTQKLIDGKEHHITLNIKAFKDITPEKLKLAQWVIDNTTLNSVDTALKYPEMFQRCINEGLTIDNEYEIKILIEFLDGKIYGNMTDLPKLTEEQKDLVFHLERHANKYNNNLDLTESLYEQISGLTSEKIREIKPLIEGIPAFIELEKVLIGSANLKVLKSKPGLLEKIGEIANEILSADIITPEALEVVINDLPELSEAAQKQLPEAFGYMTLIRCAEEVNLISNGNWAFGIRDVYEKLANTKPEVAKQLYDMLVNTDQITRWIKNTASIDFAIKALEEGKPNKFVKKILDFNGNIQEQTAAIEEIKANKDQILRQIQLRCQNTTPEFAEWVKYFLNSDAVDELFFEGGINVKTLIDNLFATSKILYYVNSKPQDYINGHFKPEIIEAVKERRSGKILEKTKFESLPEADRAEVENIENIIRANIDNQYEQILKAISATDLETVKLLLDKRFEVFNKRINDLIDDMQANEKTILADIIRNGKRINKNGKPEKLTGQQKVDLITMIKILNQISSLTGNSFDFDKFKTPIDNKTYIFDIESLHKEIFNKILSSKGLTESELATLKAENLNWDMRYISLLSQTPVNDAGELATVIREASKGNFAQFIQETSNPHGQANVQTKARFAELGLNYENWTNGPEQQTIKVGNEEYTIKLWNRIPQESLFDGTYTTCCTALDGGNGGSMANYLLNTAINVVEVKDKQGNIVGMSRCYMGELDGIKTLVMENIEVNNQLIKKMNAENTTSELANGIFNYMKDFATMVGGEETPVYMSDSYHKINSSAFYGLENTSANVTFIGNISKPEIYLNTYKGYVETDKLENKYATFHIIRGKKHE